MKKVFILFFISLLVFPMLNAQDNNSKNDPVGKWKFEAPYAPEGYTSGTIIVAKEEAKYTASMSFAGSEYKLPADKVQAVRDSVMFTVYLEGQDIKVYLKMSEPSKMAGKAVYSEGEVPLTLTKSN
jgi:hypothetical protein